MTRYIAVTISVTYWRPAGVACTQSLTAAQSTLALRSPATTANQIRVLTTTASRTTQCDCHQSQSVRTHVTSMAVIENLFLKLARLVFIRLLMSRKKSDVS